MDHKKKNEFEVLVFLTNFLGILNMHNLTKEEFNSSELQDKFNCSLFKGRFSFFYMQIQIKNVIISQQFRLHISF